MNKSEIYDELQNIAFCEGLELVETTTGTNGYPRNIGYAITGFKDYEQFESIVEMYGLQKCRLYKKNGWHFYENHGWYYDGCYDMASLFGDEVCCYVYTNDNIDKEDFIKKEDIVSMIKDCGSLEEMKSIIDRYSSIWEIVSGLEEDEIAVHFFGCDGAEVMKKDVMSYSYDSQKHTIGAYIFEV